MDRVAAAGVSLSRMHFPVTTLGPGRRIGIWFQGCSIRCQGCLAMDTWDPGDTIPVVDVLDCMSRLVHGEDGVDGITISGGEPFDQPDGLEALLVGVGESPVLADLDVLVYSGYTLSVIERRYSHILHLLDALISGPFVSARPTKLPWRGSANQVLTCLSGRASERFDVSTPESRIQVSVEEGRVWMIGIPRLGDLDHVESSAAQRGVRLEQVSWRV